MSVNIGSAADPHTLAREVEAIFGTGSQLKSADLDHQQLGASTHPFSKVFVSDDADQRTVRRQVAQNDRLAIPFGRGLRCRRVQLQGSL